jgi:DNA repair protein RecN (Recombination protein N)
MLEKLSIKNFLLLKNIEIDFSPGFNIITGETGAGKSILINALNLLIGERADYSIISKNKEKMIIEGTVKVSPNNKAIINKILKENDIETFGDNVIIRRELYAKAYSRNFINDTPVGTNELKKLGEIIVDIHSQNEHQSLLKKEIHIDLLDSYISGIKSLKFAEKINDYKTGYDELKKTENEYNELLERKSELDSKKSFMEFQLKEIAETNPLPNEDEELEKELKTSENIESIQISLQAAYENIYNESGSAVERIKIAEKELTKISQFNEEAEKILKDITESSSVLNEAGRQLQSLIESLGEGFEPEKLEQMRERLYKLQFLKKKYGGSLDEAIKLRETLEKDLALIENFDEKIKELENNIKSARDLLLKKAKDISKYRKDKSPQLEKEVAGILNEVGFENAQFKVDINTTLKADLLNINGVDDIEFMVKINKGDEFTPLRKTASGGEVSRVMLAVKSVLADADKVNTLVFDEIDTGISGRIAQKAGRVMKNLSAHRQVIAITHLAQIAALGDEHLLVEKETEGESAVTKIRTLNKNEKIIEIAKLLSGENVTDASIKSAKELIEVKT